MCAAVRLSHGQQTITTSVRLKQAPLLTRSRKRVLSAIGQNPGLTMSDLAREFGWHVGSIDYHLHLLRKAGFVIRQKGRGHRYELYLNGDAPR